MDVSTRKNVARRLRHHGFDLTTSGPLGVRPRCSQCQTLVINGVACHEIGCPNSKRLPLASRPDRK